jgi:ATP-dependent Clp protease ATP-binding subunit ClpB
MVRQTELNPQTKGQEAKQLELNLRRLIVGQDEAIQQVVNVYQMHLTGLSSMGRPIGNFLFLGPTGSGKTRMVEATAESVLNNPNAVIKIDCAEFTHSHEISKLLGSPPGYLGHRETHSRLSQEALGQYHTDKVKVSFLLFDEIEKASDALWNLLLGILDKATLTLGDNRKVDFSRTMVFMTSNLGATEMNALLNPQLGFMAGGARHSQGRAADEKLNTKIIHTGIAAARRKFTPEFINRLDKIVVFKTLGADELRRILDIELSNVQQRVIQAAGGRPFLLTVTDAGKTFLLDEGTNIEYGARHLKRAIDRLVVQPLSNLIATNQIHRGDWIQVDRRSDAPAMTFLRKLEGLAVRDLTLLAENQQAYLRNHPAAALFSDADDRMIVHAEHG